MEHVLGLQGLETPEAVEGHHGGSHLSIDCDHDNHFSGLSLLLCS
ncbi:MULTISPECIES: class III lanthipeptide [Amycolatopsis]|uniref:SapB/AmfS family lantipeptide n=2 Tax=Amycolatopsis TaxID=1813 RepID=A0A2A9FAH1_9PSEU|nr:MULTISPECIES: class III lanthipeptide [Amycolatopsis]PFG47953.1 hypothetical protein ATK36_3019 [Amycolatopsis sulphurea]RJQ91234.1 SapB/AmfS family lantipeptide [Amycolatopsis panacis]